MQLVKDGISYIQISTTTMSLSDLCAVVFWERMIKKKIIFSFFYAGNEKHSWWEWRSVKANMVLLKYLPRPVGGLQGNQHCYSGKLADTQNHLELIMAHSCRSVRINTHQRTQGAQTRAVCTVRIHTSHLPAHMYAGISDVPEGGVWRGSGFVKWQLHALHEMVQSVQSILGGQHTNQDGD